MSTAMTEPKQNLQRAAKAPTVPDLLQQHKAQIAAALPRHMTADRMARIAMTELRKNPELMQCCPYSFMGAVVQCAQLGLEPGGGLGHAYLVPFFNSKSKKKEVQFIPGYRGMVSLARRSGQVVSLHAHAVYEGDLFDYELGLEEKLKHKPAMPRKADAKILYVYAIAHLKDGGHQFTVMSADEVNRIAKNTGPWKDHYEEMAKKTAIRRLFKLLPVSVEMERAVGADELQEADVSQDNALVLDAGDYKVTEVADDEPAREPGEDS
jgi:recombination protein RecT